MIPGITPLDPLERWEIAEDFPDYRVSDLGRVVSLRKGKPKLLSLKPDPSGYVTTSLINKQGSKQLIGVHRLVLMAFVGRPEPGQQTCHYDRNTLNNTLANLRWDTPQLNTFDRIRHDTTALNPREYAEVTALILQGRDYQSIANRYRVSHRTIENVAFHVGCGNRPQFDKDCRIIRP